VTVVVREAKARDVTQAKQPEAPQNGRGDTFTVADEGEKKMLGADEIVPESPRFFPGQNDDSSCPFGEPFKTRMSLTLCRLPRRP
jgi:hypothetical protein